MGTVRGGYSKTKFRYRYIVTGSVKDGMLQSQRWEQQHCRCRGCLVSGGCDLL